MDDSAIIQLRLAPGRSYYEAQIVDLEPDIAHQMSYSWWESSVIDQVVAANEIDRHWNWDDPEIEYNGLVLPSRALAVVVKGEAQGGMLISTVPIASRLQADQKALLVERLFTAPHNRPHLFDVIDEDDAHYFHYFTGVGSALLKWAARYSIAQGFEGRLRLDASPNFVDWYAERKFSPLKIPLVLHEGVSYTPMELLPDGARALLGFVSSGNGV